MFPTLYKNSIKGFLALLTFIIFLNSSYSQQNILPDTIRSCKVDSLIIDAGFGYKTYNWSTGDTTQAIWVSITGQYKIDVNQGDTLFISDSVFVVIVDTEILKTNNSIICGDTIAIYGGSAAYEFIWQPMNESSDSIVVFPRDTAVYYAGIYDTLLDFNYCFDSIQIIVEPNIFADSLIQLKMGCPDSASAQMQAFISGGYPPYDYEWSEGQPFFSDPSKAWKLTNGEKILTVTDTIGCILKHHFEVKAYSLPEIELTSDPTDTVFLQKPFVHFTYENISYDSLVADTFYLDSFWWDFLGTDSVFVYDIEAPDYTYSNTGTYQVYFHYRTFYGCQDSNDVHIQIIVEPVKLKATSVLTPNDDEFNRFFEIFEDTGEDGGNNTGGGGMKSITSGDSPIDLSKYYLSNTLVIFNRYGQKVYEADNYNNDWDGSDLKDGVYFYILQCDGYYEDKTYTGSVTILRSKP
jgi:hypothetical protein